MAVTKIKPIKSTLKKALDYIQNPNKTDGKMLVSSFGCSYETADIEFGFTLSQALDRGNNLAHHLIQSFEPGEVDYEKAHEIGKQLADAVTKGQYEYVLTTHIDKGHIHNHIIFCAVNFVDYHKYVSNKRTYSRMAARTLRLWLHSPTTVRPHFCQRFLRIFRGFGKLPNKQNPRQALHEWQGFYGSGYPLPMLAIPVLCPLKWLLCSSHTYRPYQLKAPFRRRFFLFSENTAF